MIVGLPRHMSKRVRSLRVVSLNLSNRRCRVTHTGLLEKGDHPTLTFSFLEGRYLHTNSVVLKKSSQILTNQLVSTVDLYRLFFLVVFVMVGQHLDLLVHFVFCLLVDRLNPNSDLFRPHVRDHLWPHVQRNLVAIDCVQERASLD